MSGRRERRIESALQKELAQLLPAEVKDPRVLSAGLATITVVRLSRDLRHADVLVSFTGGDEAQIPGALEALQKMAGYLRGAAARRLNLKRAPALKFIHDGSAPFVEFLHRLVHDGEGGEGP